VEPFEPIINLVWEGYWKPGKIEHRRRIYDCELIFLSEGYYDLLLDDEEVALTPGMTVIIPPAYWHESIVSGSKVVFRHCVHFDWTPGRLHQAPLQSFYPEPFNHKIVYGPPTWLSGYLPAVFSPVQTEPIRWLLKELFVRSRKADKTGTLLLWPILRHFVSVMIDYVEENRAHSRGMQWLTFSLKQFIDTRYNDQIGYADFESLTKLSKSYICTQFRRLVGYPPLEYLKQIRLMHARKALITNVDANVSEVAYRVGFQSPNYFTRVFRKEFGVSPTEYRNMTLKSP